MDEHVDTSERQNGAPNAAPPAANIRAYPYPIQTNLDCKNDDKSEKISKSDRIMIGATIVIAAGTLVSAGAICFQWYEMHIGGRDTTTIAEASKRNATAAEGFATSADGINTKLDAAVGKLNEQVGAMKDLAGEAKAQAQEAKVAADAAKSAADTARNALTRGSRPWVGSDGMLILTQPIQIQLVQVPNKNLIGVNEIVSDKYTVKNFGRDPALEVSSDLRIVDQSKVVDIATQEKAISKTEDDACQTADKNAISGPIRGNIVFSNNTTDFEDPVSGSLRFVSADGFDEKKETGVDWSIMLAGCISYRDTFQTLHHTRMCFISNEPTSKLTAGSKLRLCHGSQYAD